MYPFIQILGLLLPFGCCEYVAVNVVVQIAVQVPAFNSLGCRISGLCGNSIFQVLRNHHPFLHSACTILHSRQQWAGVLISPHLANTCSLYMTHPNGREVALPFFKKLDSEDFGAILALFSGFSSSCIQLWAGVPTRGYKDEGRWRL